ncbi:hypothetical protein C4552_01980 [Candidatus Parcubacteria bacterium]|nr:MAG: hypothetical protein C4552_01980 [Candidatus Parcubacteria bacterium]
MQKRSGKFLSFIAIGVMLMFAFAAPAAEAGKSNLTTTALQAGGERLDDLQNPDGGWFFDVADANCGFGPGVSCPNTFGVTGLGLLDAYQATKDLDFLEAAILTGDALVVKQAAAPSCDGNPATSADRPFTVDVTFLQKLAKILGSSGKAYKKVAANWFACVMEDHPDGADRADNRINGRIGQGLSNLGEWDAALDIEAALAIGQKKYALQEALQVIARQPDWDVADPQCPGCELLGKGLLLEVVQAFDDNPAVAAAIAAWVQDLLAAQDPANGSWNSDTQTTAYVLMGLDAMKKTDGVKQAIKKGLLYLFSQGIGNGGYFVGTGSTQEITEVDSEVLQALWATR